jgi:ubiquitin carboxyl-terminal hydrolase 8
MEVEKYKEKGLSGLANLGNTCFINSCMQILSHTYELTTFLESDTYYSKLKKVYDTILLLEWVNLLKLLWEKNCVVMPAKFIKTIQNVASVKQMELFTGFSQNDVSEFLLFLIDCFHNALSREVNITITGSVENDTDKLALKCFKMIKERYNKDYSEIWNLFYGIHVSQVSRMDNGEIISVTPEPFLIVDLPINPNNKTPSLLDCLDYYTECEIIENFKIDDTQEIITIKKQILFWSFPTIFIIDLKRFNHRLDKNQIHVTFPFLLDLTKYSIGYKKESNMYELYGVCNHSGGVLGGHYTSFVKNANGKWYHFNDTSVSEVVNENSIISPKAYVLFYRKIHVHC